ncbi:hypothetical protein OESDEN_17768, partial [Oesophagostomum dentatum]
MSQAAINLLHIINTTVTQMDKTSDRQFSMILFDDTGVRFVSSTFFPGVFVSQSTDALNEIINNQRALQQSCSLDVIYKVNIFTLGNNPSVIPNDDLAYNQRSSGGRYLPVTVDGLLNLSTLLVSSANENSLVFESAEQDCSASTAFTFNVEDVATTLVINVVGVGVEGINMVSLTDPNS